MNNGRSDNYHAYLLRLWRDDDDAPWRASLQEAQAGHIHHFPTINHLIQFVNQQTALTRLETNDE